MIERRVHRRSPDGTADQSPTSITLDVTDIAIDSHAREQGAARGVVNVDGGHGAN